MQKLWSKKEDEELVQRFGYEPIEVLMKDFNRSELSIRVHANRLRAKGAVINCAVRKRWEKPKERKSEPLILIPEAIATSYILEVLNRDGKVFCRYYDVKTKDALIAIAKRHGALYGYNVMIIEK